WKKSPEFSVNVASNPHVLRAKAHESRFSCSRFGRRASSRREHALPLTTIPLVTLGRLLRRVPPSRPVAPRPGPQGAGDRAPAFVHFGKLVARDANDVDAEVFRAHTASVIAG